MRETAKFMKRDPGMEYTYLPSGERGCAPEKLRNNENTGGRRKSPLLPPSCPCKMKRTRDRGRWRVKEEGEGKEKERSKREERKRKGNVEPLLASRNIFGSWQRVFFRSRSRDRCRKTRCVHLRGIIKSARRERIASQEMGRKVRPRGPKLARRNFPETRLFVTLSTLSSFSSLVRSETFGFSSRALHRPTEIARLLKRGNKSRRYGVWGGGEGEPGFLEHVREIASGWLRGGPALLATRL